MLHRLLSSSHFAALLLSCHARWLSHCLSSPFRCTTLSSTRRTSLLSHRLSLSSCDAWRHPLILSLHQLVVVLPLDVPPSRCLVVSLSRCAASCCLVAPAGCQTIISCHPLVATPYCPVLLPPPNADTHRRHPPPLMSISIVASLMPICSPHRHCRQTLPLPLNAIFILHRN
jgi:hypothetical protein